MKKTKRLKNFKNKTKRNKKTINNKKIDKYRKKKGKLRIRTKKYKKIKGGAWGRAQIQNTAIINNNFAELRATIEMWGRAFRTNQNSIDKLQKTIKKWRPSLKKTKDKVKGLEKKINKLEEYFHITQGDDSPTIDFKSLYDDLDEIETLTKK